METSALLKHHFRNAQNSSPDARVRSLLRTWRRRFPSFNAVNYAQLAKLLARASPGGGAALEGGTHRVLRDFLAALHGLLAADLDFFRGCRLGGLLNDLSLLGALPRDVCEAVDERAEDLVPAMHVGDIGLLASAFGRCGYPARRFFECLERRHADWLPDDPEEEKDRITAKAVAGVLHGYLAHRYRPPAVLGWLNYNSHWFVREAARRNKPGQLVQAVTFLATVGDDHAGISADTNSVMRRCVAPRASDASARKNQGWAATARATRAQRITRAGQRPRKRRERKE
jgi:hypothetical protein